MAKKRKGVVSLIGAAIILIVAVLGYFFRGEIVAFWEKLTDSNEPQKPPVDILTDELSIHFLELGSWNTGDCTLIKIGDVEVLIDAGADYDSAGAIVPYVRQYCTDGVLEYVIATHAHMDHIAGFVGNKENPGIFESFVCETIIDFPRTDATSKVYANYCEYRDAEVASGAKHYTALQCYRQTDGAKRVYELAEGVELEILYQKYYERSAGTENDYSVCCIINQGNNHYLFTGDLESDGEESLVQNNNLPHCVLYKAGHHGSKTSSSYALLDEITPEVVCVCCCCGSDEYTSTDANQFPTQEFCTRISDYTDLVYVTTISTDNENRRYASMNGNIVFLSNGKEYRVECSASDTVLKDTEWFRAHRTWG